MASTTQGSSSLTKAWIAAVLGVGVYAVATWAVTEAAGGTKIEPGYSNTPNAVTSAPPAFK
jgi:hypothetical protein